MDSESLKELQAPLKDHYRNEPSSALITLHAESNGVDGVACKLASSKGLIEGGLHPATGVRRAADHSAATEYRGGDVVGLSTPEGECGICCLTVSMRAANLWRESGAATKNLTFNTPFESLGYGHLNDHIGSIQ